MQTFSRNFLSRLPTWLFSPGETSMIRTVLFLTVVLATRTSVGLLFTLNLRTAIFSAAVYSTGTLLILYLLTRSVAGTPGMGAPSFAASHGDYRGGCRVGMEAQ
jgi:hypothetical protein